MRERVNLCVAAAVAACMLVAAIYWAVTSKPEPVRPAIANSGLSRGGETLLLARLVYGEANAEPYEGQVAVAAVVLNRVEAPGFPKTIADVIFEPDAFESVSNGLIWASHPSEENIAAATAALNGWDPTYGCTYFWNPYMPVSPWIWTRQIVTQIGRHVFGY